ncbi:MAG: helix-turn-helix transcriptional regulator [Prolixibacteraceae bacterium]|jgi:transcriptional regulator with XRE-family HTH domain|nr:helix-turn-helix transcriptional regulator [Prolixibacteraceae bacterium]
MKDRIVKFIESEHITAAEFADKIGVQRSSVSHVLNGRNNPGYSFIQKIIEAFPTINSRWLLTGDGSIYENNEIRKGITPQEPKLFSTTPEEEIPTVEQASPKPTNWSNITDDKQSKQQVPPIIPPVDNSKIVTRVLIFYDDQTFDDFRPAK